MIKLIKGTYTQFRSLWMVFSHAWRKRDTILYPEQMPYVPPRYRGRIVLTRDPDGEERCVACTCVRLLVLWVVFPYRKQKPPMVVGFRSFSVSTFHAVFSAVCVKKLAQQRQFN